MRRDAPVTWLASYPRSGNTLLRIVLRRCFGLNSQSLYDDQEEFTDPFLCAVVGEEAVGDDPSQFLEQARRAGRHLYVKTHELPAADHNPAICVIRDGRSAIVSYAHYLRQFQVQEVTLADVILGKVGHSWSRHVEAWTSRPNTLVVRYEDLAAGDIGTLNSIATFIGAPQRQAFDVPFERLQALNPNFFRCGSDGANIAEMDAEKARLFEECHGATLRSMGYGEMRAPSMSPRGHEAKANLRPETAR